MTPASLNFIAYRQNDYSFSFILKDTAGDPFDMSLISDITMRVFRSGREPTPIFDISIDITASTLSGRITAAQTESIRALIPYYEINAMMGADRVTLFNGSITTNDASTGDGATQVAVDAEIDLGALEVTVTIPPQAAVAIAAATRAETAAGEAEAVAVIATTQAGIATSQAGIATTQAGIATTGADTATTQAGIATTGANTATTKAAEAVISADTATTQAGIATVQAGISTDQAVIATAQAGIATTQAGIATTGADTATTQAGIATTQAGIATTQAGIATTGANTATTQAGIATTQAGIATDKATEAAATALTVENAVDAFDQSNNAILAVSMLNNVAQRIGSPVYVASGEPANGTIPDGFVLLFVDGVNLKFKRSDNSVVTL